MSQKAIVTMWQSRGLVEGFYATVWCLWNRDPWTFGLWQDRAASRPALVFWPYFGSQFGLPTHVNILLCVGPPQRSSLPRLSRTLPTSRRLPELTSKSRHRTSMTRLLEPTRVKSGGKRHGLCVCIQFLYKACPNLSPSLSTIVHTFLVAPLFSRTLASNGSFSDTLSAASTSTRRMRCVLTKDLSAGDIHL